ncbi:hypothetical protein ABIB48_002120 [Arthrobacter sp. UYCu511]
MKLSANAFTTLDGVMRGLGVGFQVAESRVTGPSSAPSSAPSTRICQRRLRRACSRTWAIAGVGIRPADSAQPGSWP